MLTDQYRSTRIQKICGSLHHSSCQQ